MNYPEWLEGAGGGSHHSVDVVRGGQTLRFVKQIDRDFLESLIKAFSGNLRVLVASISVEETAFALMSRIGIRMLGTMPNKSPPSKRAGSYELTAYLRDVGGVNLSRYIGQTKPSLVMLAAPSMLLDSVKKSIASLAVPVKYVAIHEGGALQA